MPIDADVIWLATGVLLLVSFSAAVVFFARATRWKRSNQAMIADHKNALDAAHRETREATEEHAAIRSRFASVLDVEAEAEMAREKRDELLAEIEVLRKSYSEKKTIYDRLVSQLAVYDERLAFAELGVYEPHFEFDDSEAFKAAIRAVRDEQKAAVQNKRAVLCNTPWTVDGSQSKGQTMINRGIRLTLRAFNNECDVAIANARWNNANAMIKRIKNARVQIDKMNASNDIHITQGFEDLKLKELRLTHEYRETLKRERDERSEAARLVREEKRLLKDAEDAKREEAKYEALLAKARAEVGVADAAESQARIDELEQLLAEAHEKTVRAQAMAEKTKCGFVYVISNVGSFGDDVVKIGLTRRLDPMDRVKELGDASVPFLFDTHAMIYSEEAPSLEAALHAEFNEQRINVANTRKEFFRVSLSDVEAAVSRLAPEADFFTDVEAQEYRETLARREAEALRDAERDADFLPDAI